MIGRLFGCLCGLALFAAVDAGAARAGETPGGETGGPMSELRIETWSMPGADVGPENPLPPLQTKADLHAIGERPGIPDEIRRNIVYGRVHNPLPYTMQDRYTRDRRPREFAVAVLENEHLRAVFLLELGGRLWSLFHKPSGRELLYVNPVFQPANLAIRNAWFSGGVEWNIGTIGHTPYTCAPLFAGRLTGPGGEPVLRLYEWERIRRTPYQIDASLPSGSPVLLVRVRIRNPHDTPIPMYWWSNMAVPETPETRILVPAVAAYKFGYGPGGLGQAPIPILDGMDVTYTTNFDRAGDFFFQIPEGGRPWIASLDGEGRGLIQTSTARLRGRKLFFWGLGAGGNRWQEFLSQAGEAYLETQAGLARTQLEHLPMPAGAEWEWLEAYGLMEAEAPAVHGADWALARETIESKLEDLIPRRDLDAELERGRLVADQPMDEVFHTGSGWGALEAARRKASGEPPFSSEALDFPESSLGEQQAPWLALLRDGRMPEADPVVEPLGYMVQTEWRDRLERSVSEGRGGNWNAWMHLGVMRYHAGERDGARAAWEESLRQRETPWTLRNLAVLALEDKDVAGAAELYAKACRLRPELLPLAAECGKALVQAEHYDDWLALAGELPDAVRSTGRIRLLEGQAALGKGDLDFLARLFEERFVIEDLREGETSASNLWIAYHEKRLSLAEGVPIDDALHERVLEEFPVPAWIDFRMSAAKRK